METRIETQTRIEQEGPVERLARLTAEESDRLARKRQAEWLYASTHPVYPKWIVSIAVIAGIISLIGTVLAFR